MRKLIDIEKIEYGFDELDQQICAIIHWKNKLPKITIKKILNNDFVSYLNNLFEGKDNKEG